jgi:hypothetical protein
VAKKKNHLLLWMSCEWHNFFHIPHPSSPVSLMTSPLILYAVSHPPLPFFFVTQSQLHGANVFYLFLPPACNDNIKLECWNARHDGCSGVGRHGSRLPQEASRGIVCGLMMNGSRDARRRWVVPLSAQPTIDLLLLSMSTPDCGLAKVLALFVSEYSR